ncbi:hypothetical protein RQM59_11930 [Flavobacteriaceae bacterium S356]|uniref:Uncharacterized protein n=1 Tax=Asprobacillus argus TaxID=3076534 RepID=A0ABU3LH93_9FLAO|nr:hypothetical protein [Flavobacteriaceae bacterium S356]
MIKKLLFLLTICCCVLNSYSQNIYKIKLEGCDTEQFALESKHKTAKLHTEELTTFLTENISENTRKKIRGTLKLQIIVYTNGRSCLLSYENATNVTSSMLEIEKLKGLIDSKLVWENGKKNVAALIEIKFKRKKTLLTRYGMDAISGWHELKK